MSRTEDSEADRRAARTQRRVPLLEVAVLTCAVVALSAPFLDKPFHIDDPIALAIAAKVRVDPLDPLGGQIAWHGTMDSFWEMETNPPLVPYYLAPFAAAFGESERALHAAMLPFPVLLGLGVLSLSRRFTSSRWLAGGFVLSSASVLVAVNLMRDVPAAAFATAGIAAFVVGVDTRRRSLAAIGSLLIGCAVLSKYSAAIFLVLLPLYPLLHGVPRASAWILVPLAMLGGWGLHGQLVYGEPHLMMLVGKLGGTSPWRENLCSLPVVVGCSLYLAPLLLGIALARRDALALGTAALAALGCGFATQRYLEGAADAQFLFWSLGGAVLLGLASLEGVRGLVRALRSGGLDRDAADAAFLTAWLAAAVLFSVLFVPFQAMRHLLLALPPLVLLAFRAVDRAALARRPAVRWALSGLVLLQTAVALLVAVADYEYADSYRDFASRVAPLRSDAGTTWYAGTFGWDWYARRAGLRQLNAGGQVPRLGDRVIQPAYVDQAWVLHQIPQLRSHLLEVHRLRYESVVPLRTYHADGAGFYALFVTRPPGFLPMLPYRWLPGSDVETFVTYEVVAAAPPLELRRGVVGRPGAR